MNEQWFRRVSLFFFAHAVGPGDPLQSVRVETTGRAWDFLPCQASALEVPGQ